jgi:hypothetical protein
VENVLEEEMSCDSLPWHRRSPKLAAEARLAQDKVPHSICQPCSFQQYSIIILVLTTIHSRNIQLLYYIL